MGSRLNGFSFSQLDDSEKRWATDRIVLDGAAIYGCSLPQTDFFADAISKQMVRFIGEFGYGDLTLDEILLAMLLNADGAAAKSGIEIETIRFSGICMNVMFLAEVLSNYLAMRNLMERKIQNHLDGY